MPASTCRLPKFSPRRFAASATLGVLSLATGCLHVAPAPLTDERVDRALALPAPDALRIAASEIRHPILAPVTLHPDAGFSPDELAVVAVLANPDLRAVRDARASAAAQLLQAGLLPNPQINAGLDVPYQAKPGDRFTAGTVGLSWDLTSLISRDARRRAAAGASTGVELDLAWKEWQAAEAAKLAAYDLLALRATSAALADVERTLSHNRDFLRTAVEHHDRTTVDLSAAEAAAQDAHANVLAQDRETGKAILQLNRAIGLAPDETIALRDELLPSHLEPPSYASLVDGLNARRLDLLALKRGYESQEATLRATVLSQFPKFSLGLNTGRDTADVRTVGVGATIDVPLFDRNQGAIAAESATRQRLFDEYAARVYAARFEIAAAIQEIRSTNAQIAAVDAAIPSLAKMVDGCRAAVERGDADAFTLFAAQSALAARRVDAVKLRQQLVDAWISLEITSGQRMPMGDSATTRPTSATTRGDPS